MIKNYKQKIRTALAATCLFASFSSVMAQVPSRYNLSISSGTYTPLTVAGGATELPSVIADDANSNLTGLPGFTVDGVTYTNYQVNSNGRVVLYSTTAPTATGTYSPLSSSITDAGVVIAPFGRDLNNQTGTNCLYQVVGNNIIFDYQNYRRFNVTGESLNFQVILNTLNGSIQFVYGTMTPSSNTTYPEIGFRTTTSFPNNVNNLLLNITGSPTTCNWSNAVTGAAGNSTMYFNSANPGVSPSNGLTFTWTPQNVVGRVSTFSAVSAITTDGATIGWTAPAGATQYNVQYRAVGSCSWTNWSGNPVTGTTLALTGLSPLTTYQVRVQSSDGTNSPIYSQIFNAAGTGSGYNASGSFTTLPAGCTGTPTAGVTTGPAGACSGVNFNLTLTGAVTGDAGLSFQWQSSPDGTTYTDISGATSATYTANQTTATYYQCVITCANGGATAISTPLQVNMNALINCYCNVNFPTGVEPITLVNIGSINNTSTNVLGGPSLQDFTSQTTDLALGSSNPIIVKGNTGGNFANVIVAFIDWNQDGDFLDAGESFNIGTITNSTGIDAIQALGSINVPLDALLGTTKLRVVKKFSTAPSSCENAGYGQAEDYLVNVICPTIAAPSVTGATACSGNTLNLSASGAITGSTLTWYDAAVAGTIINTGLTFTTPTLTTTTSYWVEESILGCSPSPLAEVIATISPVDAELVAIDATCNGVANGSFSLGVISCGTEPFTYSVNSGAFGAIPTDLAAGTYSIVIQDAGSLLSAPITLVISEPTSVITTPVGTNASICLNETSAIISATGTVTPLLTGTQVISFDVATQPIEVNAAPGNIVTTATMTALPAGATVTSASFVYNGITANGGSWQSEVRLGFAGAIVNNAAAGTGTANAGGTFNYTRTIPNAAINTAGGTVDLLYWESSNDVSAGDDATFPLGASVATLTINYEYPAPVVITWWDAATGGTQLGTGATLETIGTSVLADASAPGVFNFYAQGENSGCNSATRALVTTTVNALPTVSVISDDTDNTVCENTMVTLTGAGAATYTYTGSINDGVAFAATSTETYTVTGTDANGCVNTSDITITVNPAPVVTATSNATNDIICLGDDVTLTAGGTAVSYTWDNSVVDGVAFTPTVTATYTATGVDAIGCENTATITITVNDPIVTASSDATANAVCDGDDVTLTGGGAVTYTWDNLVVDGASFIPTATTTYTVTGTDAIGCENTATITITLNALPTVSVTSDDTDNTVCENTMVTLTGAGAATYSYTGGVNEGVAFPATSTETYTVTGVDANGCSNTSDITITVNAAPTVTATSDVTNNTLCGSGDVTLTAAGNAVTYTWDNSVVDGVAFTTSSTNTYTVTGVDAIGCENTASITITVNAIPTVSVTSDDTDNTVCENTMVTLTGAGAATYTYTGSVSDGVAFAATSTETYTITGTDANGCTNTSDITITVNALPTVSVTSDDTDNTVCENTLVTLTGSGAATYTYTGSVNDGVAFAATSTETYTVTGTDANGCTNTDDITITVSIPTVTAASDVTNDAICGSGDVTLTGGGAVSYLWDNSVVDGVAFTTSSTNTYTVTGTDAFGCTNTATITITVNTLPTVSANSNDANNAICIGSSVIVTGVGASTYTYTGGISEGVAFTPTATNTYTVTGTDANGCVNTGTITITVNQLPVVDIAPYTEAVCDVVTNYSLTNVSPLAGVFSGANVTGTTFNPSAAGVGVHPITYTVTDINGCVGSDVENITVGDCSGIEENSTIAVSVYPNPTNGEFTLSINNANFSNITISIVDIHGKVVYNEMNVTIAQDFIKQINVSDLARGVYFVKLNNGSDISTQKLIIQ